MLSELVALRDLLGGLAARCRGMRNDERGEVTMERTILTTVVITLAIMIVALGVPKLVHLFAGS